MLLFELAFSTIHDLFNIQLNSFMSGLLGIKAGAQIPDAAIAALQPFVTDWGSAFVVADIKGNRTPTQTAAMDKAYRDLQPPLDEFLNEWIRSNPNVPASFITDLGGHIIKQTKSKIGVSTDIPAISHKDSQHNVCRVRIDNPDAPKGASSPKGYKIYMEMFIGPKGVSPEKITWGNAEQGKGRYFTWKFTDLDEGSYVYFRACYVNDRREKGTFSTIISFIIM